ncbi:hypothetical protein KYT24_004357 [Salmonella enterica]|nr:hypothetical protein [Salmonella enterica]
MLSFDTLHEVKEVDQDVLAFILGINRFSIPRMSRLHPEGFPVVTEERKHRKKFFDVDQSLAFALAYYRLRADKPHYKNGAFFAERAALIESVIAKRAAAKGM